MTSSTRKTSDSKLERLAKLKEQGRLGGGLKAIERQHGRGKLTARERLDLLLDPGTFQELDSLVTHRATDFGLQDKVVKGDAVVTGYGYMDGRMVCVFSQDFTVFGGSISEVVGEKTGKVMDLALSSHVPLIGIFDSGGARIQEGVDSLAAVGEILFRNVRASGVIPQISVIMGPAAGGAVYSPAITDFVFMVKGVGQMYITGPDVVKAVTGEEVTHEELGGALANASKSGVAQFVADDEKGCLDQVRRLLSFLPSSNREDPPMVPFVEDPGIPSEDLGSLVPDDPSKPYDMTEIISRVVDHGDFMEVASLYAPNIIVGYGRLNGRVVGIVAQQPMHLAGVLDIAASLKGARFVRFCDAFNIPLVTFVDVPGFLPGTDQEYGGIIKHGAKLIFAYAEATVPKLTVVTRKAYGGAYIVMSSKHLGGDINYAWPSAEIAVMGASGAVNIVSRAEIKDSADPDETRARLVKEYEENFNNPYKAAGRGFIDDVIDPAETRPKLIVALEMLRTKREELPAKKHGNIPL
ncbi:MAG: acyl-CoA carboxylase subunit beta [Chloroflexi bacterium]|nr:acyl-CoA carboxylase subunit beta [Chloroflexota bacterium]